jgi:hypothetical protein
MTRLNHLEMICSHTKTALIDMKMKEKCKDCDGNGERMMVVEGLDHTIEEVYCKSCFTKRFSKQQCQ